MQITLYINSSERNAINKSLSGAHVLTGNLRNESSIIKPSILITHSNPTDFNYCYIPSFGRYYFVSDMVSVRTGLWRIECTVDVLMSFRSDILSLDVTVKDCSTGDQRPTYMPGDVWQTTVKTKTDVINFPSGLLNDGEYILITSGGIVS